MMHWILLLPLALTQESTEAKRFTLTFFKDGRVELTLPSEGKTEEGGQKTVAASSMAELVNKHPDLARLHGLDKLADSGTASASKGADSESWRLRFGERWFWDRSLGDEVEAWLQSAPLALDYEEFSRWLADQRELFEKVRAPEPRADGQETPGKLGILIAPVGDTQARRLNLGKTTGVVVAAVGKGSLAERSGLRRDDVLLKINGKEVSGTKFFREEVLRSPSAFEVDVLRDGKTQTIKVEFSR